MKSKCVDVLQGTKGQFKKELKAIINDYINDIRKNKNVTEKSALYMFKQALNSQLIADEIEAQVEFYIEEGYF